LDVKPWKYTSERSLHAASSCTIRQLEISWGYEAVGRGGPWLFLGQYALCQPYVSGIVNKIRMDFGIGYTVFKISK
jgi:hypothetical protein